MKDGCQPSFVAQGNLPVVRSVNQPAAGLPVHYHETPKWIKLCFCINWFMFIALFTLISYIVFIRIPATTNTTPDTPPSLNQYEIGDYKLSVKSTSHSNWLLCDGSFVTKQDYPELYALIGDVFGSNSVSFALPNATNQIVGVTGDIHTFGSAVGSESQTHSVTLAQDNLPAHSHILTSTEGASPDGGKYMCKRSQFTDNKYVLVGCSAEPTTYTSGSVGKGKALSINTNKMQPTQFIANLFIYAR